MLLLVLLLPVSALANEESDPLEAINRGVFAFNDATDAVVLRPVSAFYDKVTPTPARKGIRNFLGNFNDVNAALNALLQGRFEPAMESTGRVLINSTLGFFGLFDVATDMGIPRYRTDFGHTLSLWGVPSGPYVVLPLLGPRTLRSAFGTGVDGFASPVWNNLDTAEAWSLRSVEIVEFRAQLLETDQLISGDRYIFLRDVYLQQRDLLTGEASPVDDFSSFDDEWEEDEF